MFTSQLALINCLPVNSGMFPHCLRVAHLVCRQSPSFICVCAELSGICCAALCVRVHGAQLCRAIYDPQTTGFCATGDKHGSIVTIMSRGANFCFSDFFYGALWLMSELYDKTQTDMFYFSFFGCKQHGHHVHSSWLFCMWAVGRETLMR